MRTSLVLMCLIPVFSVLCFSYSLFLPVKEKTISHSLRAVHSDQTALKAQLYLQLPAGLPRLGMQLIFNYFCQILPVIDLISGSSLHTPTYIVMHRMK